MQGNVRVVDYGPFQESRCFFETFDETNDIDPVSQKAGVRCHFWLTALFLKIFGKIEEYKTADGKILYLNRASFEKWRLRHYANLPQEMQISYLPTAAYIIECRKKLLSQKHVAEAGEVLRTPTAGACKKMEERDPSHKPDEGIEISKEAVAGCETFDCGQGEKIRSPQQDVDCATDAIPAHAAEGVKGPSTFAGDGEEIDFFDPEEKCLAQDAPEESDELSSGKGEKVLNLAKRWGLKVVPALFPELKAPLAIMKSTGTVFDAVESYQSGDKLGAIKKVAPLAVGGALLMYGGPVVAAGVAAYKAYSMASLLYDTVDLFGGEDDAVQAGELAESSDRDTADEMDEEHLLWV